MLLNRGQGKLNINSMYTEKQLVSFGNYLLERYDVQVYSTDGKNTPLYQREVYHADCSNWKATLEGNTDNQLPSRFQINDLVSFRFTEDAPKIPARIHAVHFTTGKVKYDVIVKVGEDDYTRVYNLDSCFVDEA